MASPHVPFQVTPTLSDPVTLSDAQQRAVQQRRALMDLGTLYVLQAEGDGLIVGAPPMQGIRFHALAKSAGSTSPAKAAEPAPGAPVGPGVIVADSLLTFERGNWQVRVQGVAMHWLALSMGRFEVDVLAAGLKGFIHADPSADGEACTWQISQIEILELRPAEPADEPDLLGM